MFQSGAQFMILVALAGLVLMRESRQVPLNGVDENFADFLAIHARRSAEPAPITLVAIDESSLGVRPWPWTPLDFALFFQSSEVFKPEALATDEVLHWEARSLPPETAAKLPQYHAILREHLLRAAKVLTAARLGYPEDPTMPPPVQETPIIRNISGDLNAIPEFTALEAQADEDFRLSSTTGFTNLPRASRYSRTVPMVLRYHGQVVPSFVLQAILIWEKLTTDDVVLEAGAQLTLGDRLRIPINEAGRLRIDFGLPRRRCGFDELVLASDQAEHGRTSLVPRDWLTGKFLLLARTDAPARTLHFAPGRRGSPGELFAAAIGTIQNGSFIQRVPVWFDLAVIGLLTLVARRCRRWGKLSTFLVLTVASVVYFMLAISLFGRTLIWLPLVLPMGLAGFVALFRLATPGVVSEWETVERPPRR